MKFKYIFSFDLWVVERIKVIKNNNFPRLLCKEGVYKMGTDKTSPSCHKNSFPHETTSKSTVRQYSAALYFRSILTILFLLLLPKSSFGWDNHAAITRLAASNHNLLKKYNRIKVTSLDQFLKKIGKPKKEWLKELYLSPDARFDFETHYVVGQNSLLPKPGSYTTPLDTISAFSDEPDWGMDQNLTFSEDQKYLGGNKGPTSRTWRHCYLSKFDIKRPLTTFHIPFRAIGEAPERAALMTQWSIKAFRAGDPYWGFRFLGWALHYLEDLGQPFHASLLPSFRFLAVGAILKGWNQVIKETTLRVGNYHYLFEFYVDHQLVEAFREDSIGLYLRNALGGKEEFPSEDIKGLAKDVADKSNVLALTVGESIIEFFGTKYMDSSIDITKDPKKYHPDILKPQNVTQESKIKFKLVTVEAFELTGKGVRRALTLVSEELEKKPSS